MSNPPWTMMRRLADRLAYALALSGVGVLGLVTLVLMADIAARKTIGYSMTGTVDLTQLAQMYCVSFALPLAFLREGHVSVDFITDRLPLRALAVLKGVAHLVCMVLLAAIACYSLEQAGTQIAQGDTSQTLALPIALYWAPLLIGTPLAASASLLLALCEFAELKTVLKTGG